MSKDKDLSRRDLLRTGAAASAGIVLASAGMGTAEARRALKVPRRTLGKTGKKVPILVAGTAMRLDQRFDPKLAEGVRYGVDYIDTAAVYAGGTSEGAVGAYHTRAKNRSKLWITSKSMIHDPAGFENVLNNSLTELKTKYIDLYFLHSLKNKKYLTKEMGKLGDKLKRQGKIRHIGFSCHGDNVAELLEEAAKHSWVEVVMFRYNFRQYGNKKLNRAIDKAKRANVGLIAMKTQGSAVSFKNEWQKFHKTGKWNKHQAVLKAVWADKRIDAVVSHMDTLTKLRENIAAALDLTKLTRTEFEELDRYATATRKYVCDGCDHICGGAVDARVRIGDTMRYVMYHDVYGQKAEARRLFRALPTEARNLARIDFSGADAACPHGLSVTAHMRRAMSVLA